MSKEDPSAAPAPRPHAGERDETQEAAAPKKPYKAPTISRHGNLRLMTQLE